MIAVDDVSFRLVSRVNLERCELWHLGGITDWSPLEWAGAMCGEAGEAANVAKKIKRVDYGLKGSNRQSREELVQALAKEVGDTYLYLDLLAQSVGLSMEDCVRHAFNKTSEKEGFPQRIP